MTVSLSRLLGDPASLNELLDQVLPLLPELVRPGEGAVAPDGDQVGDPAGHQVARCFQTTFSLSKIGASETQINL